MLLQSYQPPTAAASPPCCGNHVNAPTAVVVVPNNTVCWLIYGLNTIRSICTYITRIVGRLVRLLVRAVTLSRVLRNFRNSLSLAKNNTGTKPSFTDRCLLSPRAEAGTFLKCIWRIYSGECPNYTTHGDLRHAHYPRVYVSGS